MDIELTRKYNVPGPRYTSYPTVPFWDTVSFNPNQWALEIRKGFANDNRISLYIHLPFCEHLCLYCGCNTRITKNHDVEGQYIQAVLKEWRTYLEIFGEKPVISSIHLGGGTPTFFHPANLTSLIGAILDSAIVPDSYEYSFEGHPGNTTHEHLENLYHLGFIRVSFGIQDFDPGVQRLIRRIQPFEKVKYVTERARAIGYQSINFDLIYGLPGQHVKSISDTIRKAIVLNPDRIAFYSYAHVPHLKPAQQSYASFLPEETEKRTLYEVGKTLLVDHGYREIGMDHFARPSDDLFKASLRQNLYRNFMGYSLQPTQLTVGLGVSAIGDTWTAFAQNVKSVEDYYASLHHNELPIMKGHRLSDIDLVLRRRILDLICRYETTWTAAEGEMFGALINIELLDQLSVDGLIKIMENGIIITSKGRPFVRNVCMAFDARLIQGAGREVVFSKTV